MAMLLLDSPLDLIDHLKDPLGGYMTLRLKGMALELG